MTVQEASHATLRSPASSCAGTTPRCKGTSGQSRTADPKPCRKKCGSPSQASQTKEGQSDTSAGHPAPCGTSCGKCSHSSTESTGVAASPQHCVQHSCLSIQKDTAVSSPPSTNTPTESDADWGGEMCDFTSEFQMAGSTSDTSADSAGLTPQDYMLLHRRCAVCHWPLERRGRWLELHHIIGGAGRKNLPCGSNYLTLCNRCHHAVHDRLADYGELPKGAILTAKEEEDGEVDVQKLAALRRRKALPYDPCPIPDQFLKERHRRGGDPWP
jgi:hypothetical protein